MTTSQGPTTGRADHGGFTLVEILIVIVIIGILATVVVFAVRAIVDRGEKSSCAVDRRILVNAAEVYFAENQAIAIPATGAAGDGERFERTLIDGGRLGEFSRFHDLNADGTVTIIDSKCV